MHVKLKQVFRPTGVLNRFTELRHSKIKYKYVFIAKTPYRMQEGNTLTVNVIFCPSKANLGDLKT